MGSTLLVEMVSNDDDGQLCFGTL